MSNFLVTGGAGFIGSNVANRLLKEGHRVIIYDNLSRDNVFHNVMWLITNNKRIRFIQSSVRNHERVREVIHNYDIDFVFHFAGRAGGTSLTTDPWGDFQDNLMGTFNVLEAARSAKQKPHVVFASTNQVYKDLEIHRPVSEKQPLSFTTPYGCSSGAADQYCLDYYRTYGLPTTVLRTSCVYGNRQFGTEEQGWLAHFMFSKSKDKPITIYGDGTQIRDVLYIDDYVDLCMALVDNQEKVAGRVFNIGGGPDNQISVIDAAKKIGNEYSLSGWRKYDPLYYVSDITLIDDVMGWEPKVGIEEGLEKLEKWINERKD